MSHEIVVEFKGDHVYARHSGATSREISLDLWRRVMKSCEEHGCYNILGESDTTNALSTLDAFAHVEIANEVGLTLKHRIAWVSHNVKARAIAEFVEDVLKNRCLLNGHLFPDVEQARRWLLDRADTPMPRRR